MSYSGERSPITRRFGVLPVSIYSAPTPCGGRCTYCPTDKKFPKSYLENEDTQLAQNLNYSPFLQLEQKLSGTDCTNTPLEIIILGGSFSAASEKYREEFIESINNFLLPKYGDRKIPHKFQPTGNRCSVLTVESRPDQINAEECQFLRKLGVSKVEIGVQHTLDSVLKNVRREHSQYEVINATKLLKENGFKVGYHVMIGLPTSTLEDDIEMLSKTLWQNEYCPDYLKIYPCILLKNAERTQPILFRSWKNGSWKSPDENYCVSCLDSLAQRIPDFVRVARIQRQFNDDEIADGVPMGIRRKINTPLLDVRSREYGSRASNGRVDLNSISPKIWHRDNDVIIQMVDADDTLYAIARLRLLKGTTGIIREIKVFGAATEVGTTGIVQGKGLGTHLLQIVEEKLQENDAERVLANAAIGARSFFKQNGYKLNDDFYMEKSLLV